MTIDGVRTDYGLAPQRSDGTCNCSIPLPFSSGRHTIIASAYNSGGEAASDPLTVGPTAQAGGPYSVQLAMPVSVTASRSTDLTGTITSYVWNWGDGTQDDTSATAPASHSYRSPGTFTITLTVIDDFGASDTDSTTVAIVVPPLPDAPGNPTNGALGIDLSPTLAWSVGAPGTTYAVLFGTVNPPAQVASGLATSSYAPGALSPGTTYYWSVIATSIGGSNSSPIWSFTTGTPSSDVVIYADDVPLTGVHGTWTKVPDPTSPNNTKLATPVSSTASTSAPSASPNDYVDVTFTANAATPYTFWIRLEALDNSKWSDSAWVQFSDALVDGAPAYSIGSTLGLLVNLATDSTAASVVNWGWLNGSYWMTQTAPVTFAAGGTHTVRIQVREGGVMFDQIVLSPSTYLNRAPGLRTNDTTFVAKPAGAPAAPAAPNAPSPANAAVGVSTTAALTRIASGATSYDILFGATNPPPQVSTAQAAASYTPAALAGATTYWWRIVAHNAGGTTAGPIWSFTTMTSPRAPDAPGSPSPADGAANASTGPTLTWISAGAASYDLRFGTTNPPPAVSLGQTVASYVPPTLANSTTYFWQVVARNGAGTTNGPIWSFTTATAAPSEIVIYASDIPSSALHGMWSKASDASSPDGITLTTPDTGFAVANAPLAVPADYVDVPFTASAGTPYTLWMRLQALDNSKFNDAVWVQFSDAMVNGAPVYAVDSTSGLLINLATSAVATSLARWGWQNGAYWLAQAATLTFATSGPHTLRIQVREDGVQVDQIVLSPAAYLNTAPGPVTNDSTIVPKP